MLQAAKLSDSSTDRLVHRLLLLKIAATPSSTIQIQRKKSTTHPYIHSSRIYLEKELFTLNIFLENL